MIANDHVFISYKKEDAKTANLVRLALQALGIKVWWDQKLQTGQKWELEIDRALLSARAVLVLWSDLAVKSDWVKHEASLAKLRQILVQARIGDCDIPPPYFGTQAADLRKWNEREDDPEFCQIISEIQRVRASETHPIPPSIPWKPRACFWLAALIALSLPVSYIVFKQYTVQDPEQIPNDIIADFKGPMGMGALTAFGLPFSLMSDSSQNMESKIWYHRVQGDPQEGGFLRIYYELVPEGGREAYVGIYADFTLPPPRPVSLSKYQGISFKIRIAQDIGNNPEIRVVLYSDNIRSAESPYPIARVQPTTQWSDINIPFSKFETPPHAFNKVRLEAGRIFRFAFVLISGDKIHGQLDIDDVRLF